VDEKPHRASLLRLLEHRRLQRGGEKLGKQSDQMKFHEQADKTPSPPFRQAQGERKSLKMQGNSRSC
jgi:hypothetical protein